MAESSKRKKNAERVFEHLQHQTKALSAYQILNDLRHQGMTAATTVYRALDQLLASGRVHRIESLNAFTVCNQPRHTETPVFEICKECGDVTERAGTGLIENIEILSRRSGFQPEHSVVEIRGRCGVCLADAQTV